jgi:hypothetical protein
MSMQYISVQSALARTPGKLPAGRRAEHATVTECLPFPDDGLPASCRNHPFRLFALPVARLHFYQ